MLDKTLLGYLSIKGEVGESADPATVSQDPNDSGGWSYGLYQLASAKGSVQSFIQYVQGVPAPLNNYGDVLAAAGDPTCDQSFVDAWQNLANTDPVGFGKLQDDYAAQVYYSPADDNLLSRYSFDISGRQLPLKQVLMANSVQHGAYYGAQAFGDGAQSVGKDLDDMTDAEIIQALYDNKINDLSWTSGAPADRGSVEDGTGLFGRWARERDEAISMLS